MANRGMKNFEEFSNNPFIDKEIGNIVDMKFMLSISKSAQNIIRYMVYKKAYLEERFLFDLDDFNKFVGYTSKSAYLSGVIDLIRNNILAKTKLPHLYWVNKNLLDKSTLISVM